MTQLSLQRNQTVSKDPVMFFTVMLFTLNEKMYIIDAKKDHTIYSIVVLNSK